MNNTKTLEQGENKSKCRIRRAASVPFSQLE
uniref:Uncharacterized protein n=1 Tax=Anguilla anguilla TaxID=7936 RepID=A0A0E9RH71_ANGAN